MDKNVLAVGFFLITIFAVTAIGNFVFVAHEAEPAPPVGGGLHGGTPAK